MNEVPSLELNGEMKHSFNLSNAKEIEKEIPNMMDESEATKNNTTAKKPEFINFINARDGELSLFGKSFEF